MSDVDSSDVHKKQMLNKPGCDEESLRGSQFFLFAVVPLLLVGAAGLFLMVADSAEWKSGISGANLMTTLSPLLLLSGFIFCIIRPNSLVPLLLIGLGIFSAWAI